MNKCITCGKLIPKTRLKILPETLYCVKCSPVEKKTEEQCYIPEIIQEDLIHRMVSNN